jgi:hypothetical protein
MYLGVDSYGGHRVHDGIGLKPVAFLKIPRGPAGTRTKSLLRDLFLRNVGIPEFPKLLVEKLDISSSHVDSKITALQFHDRAPFY